MRAIDFRASSTASPTCGDALGQCEEYLDSLVIDQRGDRTGFPQDVAKELRALRSHYADLHPSATLRGSSSTATTSGRSLLHQRAVLRSATGRPSARRFFSLCSVRVARAVAPNVPYCVTSRAARHPAIDASAQSVCEMPSRTRLPCRMCPHPRIAMSQQCRLHRCAGHSTATPRLHGMAIADFSLLRTPAMFADAL